MEVQKPEENKNDTELNNAPKLTKYEALDTDQGKVLLSESFDNQDTNQHALEALAAGIHYEIETMEPFYIGDLLDEESRKGLPRVHTEFSESGLKGLERELGEGVLSERLGEAAGKFIVLEIYDEAPSGLLEDVARTLGNGTRIVEKTEGGSPKSYILVPADLVRSAVHDYDSRSGEYFDKIYP